MARPNLSSGRQVIGAHPISDKLSVAAAAQGGPALHAVDFTDLAGFAEDDLGPAFAAFRRSAEALSVGLGPLRAGVTPPPGLLSAARAAMELGDKVSSDTARGFFTSQFRPHQISGGAAFFTGYFEPVVDGSPTRSAEFGAPILSRPADLVTLSADEPLPGPQGALQAALRAPDGSLAPCPDRAAIEAGALAQAKPIVWLRDPVEVFIVQVQGSARVRLPDGRMLRLSYAGRNGWPYTSIGRILVEEAHIPAPEMSLARLKEWIREHGQEVGQAGRALMQRNRSYVFFQAEEIAGDAPGPTGAQGVNLTPLRSLAVDRAVWAYGLPFWIDAELPWHEPTPTIFRRLMIAQDTGSAIVGPKRTDIYVGSGDAAGRIAGGFRHNGEIVVLLPVGDAP